MSKQSERERFLVALAGLGVNLDTGRLLLRHAATLQRVAEAQCNGDYPYENGERKVVRCSRCDAGCVRSAMTYDKAVNGRVDRLLICPDCRVSDRVKVICQGLPVTPDFQGDPRGYVLRLVTAEGREIGVPA